MEPDVLYAPNCVLGGDTPEVMYAGISYSLKIQGRDQFHNNIEELIGDTIQASAQLTFLKDSSITLEAAAVSDDLDFPGVYQIEFDLPKEQ